MTSISKVNDEIKHPGLVGLLNLSQVPQRKLEVCLKNASRKDKAKNDKSGINNNVDMIHMLRLIKV